MMNRIPFQTQRRVEFFETDMAGIMHFSNFFRYMEIAETEFLNQRQLTVSWDEENTHYGFPRVAANCEYHHPIRFGDIVTIAVSVEKIGTKSVSYRFDFTKGETLIAVGQITAVFCQASPPGSQMVSIPIPESIREKLLA